MGLLSPVFAIRSVSVEVGDDVGGCVQGPSFLSPAQAKLIVPTLPKPSTTGSAPISENPAALGGMDRGRGLFF
ncbi:hypothetical protein SUGI_1043060 [Cryptomeria japonica]|nr:hypothetical protein SUGI_1043060 [Cryptomeria japonica]